MHDNVDEVFEQPWSRDRAVLGYVADEDDGNSPFFRDANDGGGDLTHLRDTAGQPVDGVGRNGLNRVDNDERRFDLVNVTEDGPKVGFGGEKERVDERAGAFGTQADLADRFLGTDVHDGVPACRNPTRDIQKKRRLSDARLARWQDGG